MGSGDGVDSEVSDARRASRGEGDVVFTGAAVPGVGDEGRNELSKCGNSRLVDVRTDGREGAGSGSCIGRWRLVRGRARGETCELERIEARAAGVASASLPGVVLMCSSKTGARRRTVEGQAARWVSCSMRLH